MIELVTNENLSLQLSRYRYERCGESQKDTPSQVLFILVSECHGPYLLHTNGPRDHAWISMERATACITAFNGRHFFSVEEALQYAHDHVVGEMYYTDHAVERLRWIADRLEEYQKDKQRRLDSAFERIRQAGHWYSGADGYR